MPKCCVLCKHRLRWNPEYCARVFCSRCKKVKEIPKSNGGDNERKENKS